MPGLFRLPGRAKNSTPSRTKKTIPAEERKANEERREQMLKASVEELQQLVAKTEAECQVMLAEEERWAAELVHTNVALEEHAEEFELHELRMGQHEIGAFESESEAARSKVFEIDELLHGWQSEPHATWFPRRPLLLVEAWQHQAATVASSVGPQRLPVLLGEQWVPYQEARADLGYSSSACWELPLSPRLSCSRDAVGKRPPLLEVESVLNSEDVVRWRLRLRVKAQNDTSRGDINGTDYRSESFGFHLVSLSQVDGMATVLETAAAPPSVNGAIQQLQDMGFPEARARAALGHANGDAAKAIENLMCGGAVDYDHGGSGHVAHEVRPGTMVTVEAWCWGVAEGLSSAPHARQSPMMGLALPPPPGATPPNDSPTRTSASTSAGDSDVMWTKIFESPPIPLRHSEATTDEALKTTLKGTTPSASTAEVLVPGFGPEPHFSLFVQPSLWDDGSKWCKEEEHHIQALRMESLHESEACEELIAVRDKLLMQRSEHSAATNKEHEVLCEARVGLDAEVAELGQECEEAARQIETDEADGPVQSPIRSLPAAPLQSVQLFGDAPLAEDAAMQVFGACAPAMCARNGSAQLVAEAAICVCSRSPSVRVQAISVTCGTDEAWDTTNGPIHVQISPRLVAGVCDGKHHAATRRLSAELSEVFVGRPLARLQARLVSHHGKLIENSVDVALPVDIAAWLQPLALEAKTAAWDRARFSRQVSLPVEIQQVLKQCSQAEIVRAATCGGVLHRMSSKDGQLVFGATLMSRAWVVFVAVIGRGPESIAQNIAVRSEDTTLTHAVLQAVVSRLVALAHLYGGRQLRTSISEGAPVAISLTAQQLPPSPCNTSAVTGGHVGSHVGTAAPLEFGTAAVKHGVLARPEEEQVEGDEVHLRRLRAHLHQQLKDAFAC